MIMRAAGIRFIVNAIEGDQKHVVGRCGEMPIHVGDVFDFVINYKPRKYPDEVGDTAVPLKETSVALRVAHIHAYESCLDELGGGMTGALVLDGEGLQCIAPGAVLESSPPS
jgi:hypothetical protein